MKCYELPQSRTETPGYSEIRRCLVVGAPAAMATCLTAPGRLLAAMDDAGSDHELRRFIEETAARAASLKSDASANGQDAYVKYLADAVVAVDDAATDNLSTTSWKGMDPGVFLGAAGRNKAFFVVHWRLAPGALLPAHCHPKTSVCTLGLEGAATLRHFEVGADAPSYRDDRSTEFLVRETRRLELRAGTVSTLTEHRDNVHLFEAGKSGARGIDVTTDYGGDGSFSFLELDHRKPLERGGRSYVARWTGTDLPG